MDELSVVDFLQRGSPLKTQLPNSINWIPNVVFDTYSNKEEIGVIFDDRYSSSVIFVGDTIKLNYIDGKVQYFIESCVTSIRLEAMRIMTLKINSVKKIPNLRKYERYSVNYGANIFGLDAPGGSFGVVTNISLSGLAFNTRDMYFIGDMINISILLPSGSFIVSAEIVRSRETSRGTEYGVKFVRQDDEAREEITKLIDDIKEREDRLSHIAGVGMM